MVVILECSLLRVHCEEQVRSQNGHVHDGHTSPRHVAFLGHMRELNVDSVVNIDKRIEECRHDWVSLDQVNLAD